MEKREYLECAAVRGTHGVRGNVRLESLCNTAGDLASLHRMFVREDSGYRQLTVEHSSVQKGAVLTKFQGVDSVEAAAAMRGTLLYAAREDMPLPEGEFFIADMIGLPVIDLESGKQYGTLSDVIRPGAQQIYVVKGEMGEFMIPCVPEFIKKISVGEDADGIYVSLIEGMTD